ncbi:Glutamine amidotransferase domain-containing protein [Quadrisphaera granulorum]|uniref:Glutamine amidotransferase-like protein n=1 Tax=Quadrisphaera granulorum TaxID=317664 RepID=A0A315ZKL8_9ACTN|nr:glutamine amidotransferase-like protein [Quadrisphaera granulorum]SZE99133.1 Glutamine amidotransferase domain-containing protein [Quadrisphaera granulorum]
MGVVCRLLGFAAPSPRSLAEALGSAQVAAFRAMARLHDDGWGAAWLGEDGDDDGGARAVRAERSPRSGYHDPALERVTETVQSRAGLLHLRLASSGMPVQPENTHPFIGSVAGLGDVALAHNGAMKPAARIEELLDDDARAALRGNTDSERYAALVRAETLACGDLARGAAAAAARLAPLFPTSSLNAVLVSPRELVVVHVSAGARTPHEDFDASGIAEEELPVGHRTGYYQLWRRRADDGAVVVSSSGLRVDGWEPLAADTVLRVDLRTLDEQLLPVHIDRPVSAPAGAGASPFIPAPGRHDSQGAAARASV